MKGSLTGTRANFNQTAWLSILSIPHFTVFHRVAFRFTAAAMPQEFRTSIQRPPNTRPIAPAEELSMGLIGRYFLRAPG